MPNNLMAALSSSAALDKVGRPIRRPRPEGVPPGRSKYPLPKILPGKKGAGKRGVRLRSDGDVVEDIVAREALGLALKDARDQLVAARVGRAQLAMY